MCLYVPCPVAPDSTFVWTRNDLPIPAGDGRITGATGRALRIVMLEEGDSGVYRCAYDDGSKADAEFVAVVTVVPFLPVSSAAGLAVLCGLLAATFTARVLHRK